MAKKDDATPDTIDPRDAEIAALKADLANARDYIAQSDEELAGVKDQLVKAKPEAQVAVPWALPEKYKGSKTYLVGPMKAYKDGRLYAEGEEITIYDQEPGRDWVLKDSAAGVLASVIVPPVPGRASDQNVGG